MDPIDPNAPSTRRTLHAVALQRTSGATWVRVVFFGSIAVAGIIGTWTSRQRDEQRRYEGPPACEVLLAVDDTLLVAALTPVDGVTFDGQPRSEDRLGSTSRSSGASGLVEAGSDDEAIGSICTVNRLRGTTPQLRLVLANADAEDAAGIHGASVADLRVDPDFDDRSAEDRSRFEAAYGEGDCVVTLVAPAEPDDVVVSVRVDGAPADGCDAAGAVVDAVVTDLAP